MVLSTSTILSWIEFNCKIDFVGSKILSPSNSRIILIPLSFWLVNAVNSYIPIIGKISSMLFGNVSNIPCIFDTVPGTRFSFPFGFITMILTSSRSSSVFPTNTTSSSIV